MAPKLSDFLANGGYKNEVFFGYFHGKYDEKAPRNGHGKQRVPYQIQHLHPGSNDRVTLLRVDILAHEKIDEKDHFSRLKSLEDFLSIHLQDPIFMP